MQVCVEPRPSYAAERRLQAYRLSVESISTADAGAQQQTRRPPLLLSIDGTDRRTNGHDSKLVSELVTQTPLRKLRKTAGSVNFMRATVLLLRGKCPASHVSWKGDRPVGGGEYLDSGCSSSSSSSFIMLSSIRPWKN